MSLGKHTRRQVRAMAEVALTGVQEGVPDDQVIEQLQQGGLGQGQALRLVQYAHEVELLNAAQTAAAEGVRLGQRPRTIVTKLGTMGVDDLVAAGIENRARHHHHRSLLRSGTILLAMGVLWLAAAVALLLHSGPQEMKLGISSFGLGFPLVWLGCRNRSRAGKILPSGCGRN